MNPKGTNQSDLIEIDLRRLFSAVWKKAWLVVGTAILCAVIALLSSLLFITPQYQSAAMFYVNNSSMSLGDAALSITSSDISASRGLVKSYIVILNTRETMNDVMDYAGVDYTYRELREMITAESVDSTEIFQVVVTSSDPQEAEKIANAIAYILPKRIANIIESTSTKVVDSAVVASRPSSPSYSRNTLIGFLVGFAASAAAILLWVIFDITIRTQEDVTQNCKYPILAAVPDMMHPSGLGYDYSYDRTRDKKTSGRSLKSPVLVGSGISFAAAESYKLLRTKLQFSFADENKSHIIGISSALSGEGKSLSAINLAYSLSQLDKKVILIDCDMRRPTLAEKLHIHKKPGLSNFLTGQCNLQDIIQEAGIPGEENAFFVVAAGPNPPNPIELLSSPRMEQFLVGLRDICDYVILDLPPMGEVSDALSVAKHTDGILLVVREDHCNRIAMSDTIRQFEFVDSRILGIVYNCTTESMTKYSYGYGYRYRKKYYRSAKPYQAAARKQTAKK